MKIIISPAKKMNEDFEGVPHEDLPMFLAQTEKIYQHLAQMNQTELKELWKCNDKITAVNMERLESMNLRERLTPAIFSYEGIQYQNMAPNVFETKEYEYIREHLCILSGFYGILRPFDGVTPYRLEMQAKLPLDNHKNLYQFWGESIANYLCNGTDCIVNLASNEYSKVVRAHVPSSVNFVDFTFGEIKNGKVVEKGTMCKMARGQMVRWLAERNVTRIEGMKEFTQMGFLYSEEKSTENQFVFVKEVNEEC